MTELAYMIRDGWAQHGTMMVPQSAVIREWLGVAPYFFAFADAKKFHTDRPADLETATFIAPDASTRKVISIRELAGLARQGKAFDHAIAILHPYEQRDLDALASAVKHRSLGKSSSWSGRRATWSALGSTVSARSTFTRVNRSRLRIR